MTLRVQAREHEPLMVLHEQHLAVVECGACPLITREDAEIRVVVGHERIVDLAEGLNGQR